MFATTLQTLQNLIYETLERCKSKYNENISKELCSKAIAPKYYWLLLGMLNGKKVPCILFFMTTNLLEILVKMPTSSLLLLQNSTQLLNMTVSPPPQPLHPPPPPPLWTILIVDQYLANTEFMKDDIKRIICKLDPNKAHDHDMISVRMLKISGNTIIEPLFKIFKNCLKCGIFPHDWKYCTNFQKRWQAKHLKLSSSLSSNL